MRSKRRAVVGVVVLALAVAGALTGFLVTRASGSTRREAAASTTTTSAAATATTTPHLSEHGTVQVLHVPVPGDRGRDNDVYVYRPPVPDSARLPVLYFLHGVPGHASDVFAAGLPELMDTFFAQGNPPFVLVAPDGNGAHHDDTEWANARDGTDQMETFVTRNVIAAVEGPNRRDRTRRAIAGFSMGGYGAANLALRHPDLFDAAIPMAGYFHVDDPAGMFGGDLTTIAANSPELHLDAAHGHRIFIVDGDEDNDRVVKGESLAAASTLMEGGVPVWYESIPAAHSWAFVAAAFPSVERFLDGVWIRLHPPPPEIPASLLPASVTGHWTGTADGARLDVTLPAPADDPTVRALERLRRRARWPAVSYVRVVITNPASASHAYTLAKVSFVDANGVTIDANAPAFVALEWAQRSDRASVQSAARALVPSLVGSTVVPPGATRDAILVTLGPVPGVSSVFAGDSFGTGTLAVAP